jgi:predicted aspartyl protease
LLDTGADVTGVSRSILQQLGLSAFQTTTPHTASGLVKVDLYQVSLSVSDLIRQRTLTQIP